MENEHQPSIKIAKAYNSQKGVGAQFTFVDNQLVKTDYFKIENGHEIPCAQPENCNQYSLLINLDNPEKQLVLEVKDSKTGETVSTLDKLEKLNVIEDFDIIIRSAEAARWKEVVAPVETLCKEDREKFKKSIKFTTASENKQPQTLNIVLVAKAVEDILSEKIPISSSLFRNINPSEEFGIERFVLDRIYYLPELIESIQLFHLGGMKYVAQSEKRDPCGNSVRFEHRFQSTCEEEAAKLFNNMRAKQAGIWQKIWFACWLLGNKKGQFTYSCNLSELMHTAYPLRDGYFAVGEKIEFYEHLKSIEQTRFVFSKSMKRRKRKKEQTCSYILPLIAITQEIREYEGDRYPERLTISLRTFDPEPLNEKIYHVGAAIKNKTLELHADDTQLASWIQTRKAQMLNAEFLTLRRDFLIKLAGLTGTDLQNRTVANKRLMVKLQHLQEKGILKEIPHSVNGVVPLRIR